jgi:type II secretory pathway pseudopilin PulG
LSIGEKEPYSMRTFAAVGCVLVSLALTGCGVELLTTTAIQGELQAQQLQAMRGQVQGAADSTGRINLERAIRTYQADAGVWPPSLEVLVPNFIPALPVKSDGTPYGYDPATGQLSDAPAGGPAPQDLQTMAAIRNAINQYGTETGYYPANLDQLYPNYLVSPPRTASGEPFLYDNQTGAVTHPHPAQPAGVQRPQAPTAGMGGAGPMGEVMTGMGVQQQLNSMGQSGANAAGGYARQSVGGITSGHNQQQNQAMDDLGL